MSASPALDPLRLSETGLARALDTDLPWFAELDAARNAAVTLRLTEPARAWLAATEADQATNDAIPQTTYSLFQRFRTRDDQRPYGLRYFAKRAHLAAAAGRRFLAGDRSTAGRDRIHDSLWAICEETTWVMPEHDGHVIDLFSAETAFVLAETLHLLGEDLDPEVRHRVRTEVERRVFAPYLTQSLHLHWYAIGNNWNSVCNSAVAAAFLLLEPEPGRRAHALRLALTGLQAFLDQAYEADGTSIEGVAYWHYGLINFVALSEMLRARSGGVLDLLGSDRVRAIAGFPLTQRLGPGRFASFADCATEVALNPGVLTRLAERTGLTALRDLIAPPLDWGGWRLTMVLRNLLWWDGLTAIRTPLDDAVLPVGGVARLTGRTGDGAPVVLALKAGHNAGNHSHNDIGSFILQVDDEVLLTDPGAGLYSGAYFGPDRYANLFASSFGHSVPRLGGQLQRSGRACAGVLGEVDTAVPDKRASVSFASAYPDLALGDVRRQWVLERGGDVTITDEFGFGSEPVTIEEALVSWHPVHLDEQGAAIEGERWSLRVTCEEPAGARWAVQTLDADCVANAKADILRRLTITPPLGTDRIRLRLTPVPRWPIVGEPISALRGDHTSDT